ARPLDRPGQGLPAGPGARRCPGPGRQSRGRAPDAGVPGAGPGYLKYHCVTFQVRATGVVGTLTPTRLPRYISTFVRRNRGIRATSLMISTCAMAEASACARGSISVLTVWFAWVTLWLWY